MKMNVNIRIFAVVLLSVMAFGKVSAQNIVDIDCKVTINNKYYDKSDPKSHFNTSVYYATFETFAEAQQVHNELQKLTGDNENKSLFGPELDAIEACLAKYGLFDKSRKKVKKASSTPKDGTFSLTYGTGGGVLVFTASNYNYKSNCFKIEANKKHYDTEIEVFFLEQVNKSAKGKQSDIISSTGDTGDGTVTFNVSIPVPKGYNSKTWRMIVQPVAVDCDTNDTIDYLKAGVYEGTQYHRLQDRKMGYDFHENDSLAVNYVSNVSLEKDSIIKYTVKYVKPDVNKDYKGPCTYAFEDYNHVFYRGFIPGTLPIKPFKFLEFSVASLDLPFSTEFKEEATAQFLSDEASYDLEYVVNDDVLMDTEENTKILNRIDRDIQQYGDLLKNVEIEAWSSPEGLDVKNLELAKRRGNAALRMMQNRVISRKTNVTFKKAGVNTWKQTADLLKKWKFDEHAETILNALTENKDEVKLEVALRDLRKEQPVDSALRKQRAMKVKYTYAGERILEPEEALDEYFKNKELIRSGEKKPSYGDFYNVFNMLQKDSVELADATEIAYASITSHTDYEWKPISAYIANRKALNQLRIGKPDPSILAPFISLGEYIPAVVDINTGDTISTASARFNPIDWDYVDPDNEINSMKKNRHELVFNQLVTFYELNERDSVDLYTAWLKYNLPAINNQELVEALDNITMINDFKRLHYINQHAPEYIRAKNYVLNSSDENKAILYTEVREWQMAAEAKRLVEEMADENPTKWYLKGLLWSDPNNIDFIDERAELAQNGDSIPSYLAYFQHSFDIKKEYKRLYFRDGQISDDTRNKFPYKKANIELYRRKFEDLVNDNTVEDTATNEDEQDDTTSAVQTANVKEENEDNE